ncbi:MAG: class I SAM-dependent methyltransferase [Anaerolineae bacterium]
MSQLTDPRYLRTDQYKDASNLNARIEIHRRFSTNDHPWQRWVFDHLNVPERSRILDVGCGPAHLWLENKDRIPFGWTVMLGDLSSGMVRTARHNLGTNHDRFRYRVLDAHVLPFLDRSVDAVVANHMLYHVSNMERALCEIHRVLRPTGQLYATTNGLEHLRELRDLVTTYCPEAGTPNAAARFGLENGAAQLSGYFVGVTCVRREDALVVTEAEPLIAYAKSMIPESAWRQKRDVIARAVREQIATSGAIHIRKDSGMFEARSSNS